MPAPSRRRLAPWSRLGVGDRSRLRSWRSRSVGRVSLRTHPASFAARRLVDKPAARRAIWGALQESGAGDRRSRAGSGGSMAVSPCLGADRPRTRRRPPGFRGLRPVAGRCLALPAPGLLYPAILAANVGGMGRVGGGGGGVGGGGGGGWGGGWGCGGGGGVGVCCGWGGVSLTVSEAFAQHILAGDAERHYQRPACRLRWPLWSSVGRRRPDLPGLLSIGAGPIQPSPPPRDGGAESYGCDRRLCSRNGKGANGHADRCGLCMIRTLLGIEVVSPAYVRDRQLGGFASRGLACTSRPDPGCAAWGSRRSRAVGRSSPEVARGVRPSHLAGAGTRSSKSRDGHPAGV